MGAADIENPDGGYYVVAAAAAKEDADAAMTTRSLPDEAFYWCGSIMTCCYLALVLYVSYGTVMSHPESMALVIRVDLCLLVLICFSAILCYVFVYGFPALPSKKKKQLQKEDEEEEEASEGNSEFLLA
jgi:TRAP-type C4-dicarboxylate transport system permease small subunit